MVRRAVEAMSTVTPEVVVVSSTPVPEAGVAVIPDTVEGKGPMGGLHTALREAEARGYDGVLLLGCDLPMMTSRLLARVAGALAGAPAAAPSRRGGRIEPLCAAYGLEVLEAVERLLSSDDRSLHALFRDVGGRTLPVGDLGAGCGQLFNVNTAEDRRQAEKLLRDRRDG